MTRAKDDEKQERLARALRDNLRRRKAAARQGTETIAPDAYPAAADSEYGDKAGGKAKPPGKENADR